MEHDAVTAGPPAAMRTEAAVALLLAGPALSMFAVAHYLSARVPSSTVTMALVVVLVFWSPLWFSVPALVLQDARDAALPERCLLDRVTRPFRLLGHLACSPQSSVRAEMWASLWGLAAGAVTMLLVLV